MLGARAIGTRWLGSGRTQKDDYQELSATLDAVSAGFDTSIKATRSALFASFATSGAFSGAVQRLRGVSASLTAVTAHSGSVARIRPLEATLTAVSSLSGAQSRLRNLAGTLAWVESDLGGTTGRLRSLSGSLTITADVGGKTARLRGVTGTVSLSADLNGVMRKGIPVSGSLTWTADFAGRVSDYFAPSPAFRLIYVDPKIRDLYVEPKDRVIFFAGDDRGLSMEERVKQPAEVVDYTLHMRDYFRDIFNDYITDVQVSIDITGDPDDLESGPDTQAIWAPVGDPAHQAKMWFGGGRDGETYQVTALVTTNAGRVEEVDFLVRVEEQ